MADATRMLAHAPELPKREEHPDIAGQEKDGHCSNVHGEGAQAQEV